MAQWLDIHPTHPQSRLLKQAVQWLQKGAILATPTDSSYALICHLDDKDAADRLRRLRRMDAKHHLTLLCADLTQLGSYAKVNNAQFRLLKLGVPGPYTFILEASKEIPRRLSHPSRKTLGLRVPDHVVLHELLLAHQAPVISATLLNQEGEIPPSIEAIEDELGHELGAILASEPLQAEPTTVIDLTPMATGGEPVLIRQGGGGLARLGLV